MYACEAYRQPVMPLSVAAILQLLDVAFLGCHINVIAIYSCEAYRQAFRPLPILAILHILGSASPR